MKFSLNLASRQYVNKRLINYGFLVIGCFFVLFVAWDVSTLIFSNQALKINQQRLIEVQQHLQALRGGPQKTLTSQERASLEKEYAIDSELLAHDAFRWTELLDRMEKLLPKGVSLNGFTPDYSKKSLTLNGRAINLKKMRFFLDRLLKQGGFDEVYLKSHRRIKVRDYADTERPAIEFSLQLEGVF